MFLTITKIDRFTIGEGDMPIYDLVYLTIKIDFLVTLCFFQVYPDLEHCSRYFKCANGSLTHETCGNGLLFDQVLKNVE